MTVRVGRQLRIDEDVLGYNVEQLKALIWIGNCMIASAASGGLTDEGVRQLEDRISMFETELARR